MIRLAKWMRRHRDSGPAERIDHSSPWWGEHMARYAFVELRVAGRTVLDVACGTGYGLPRLQKTAKWVVGVDIDERAAELARREVDPKRGEVLVADATRLPFGDGHFDAVTSFETLEHLPRRGEFLREISRVLSDGGVFFVSTPNANYTRPIDGKPRNPYHLHEYHSAELVAELEACFGGVELVGQRLDSRFVVPPFDWDLQQERDPVIRANAFVRRFVRRLPSVARDHASALLWGHTFFPHESDYRFSAVGVEEASVLLAICTKASRGRGEWQVK